MTTVYARGPVSVAEFEALPDDGNRYELLDGTVYVTPAPAWVHQVALSRLNVLLRAAAPPHVEVVQTPGYRANERSILIPDLVVAPHPAPGEKYVSEPPLLLVEALSPSSRTHDRVRKLAAYERAGAAAYWILDPDEPALLVFERSGDRLVERANVTGDETFAAAVPFEVVVVPAALVAR
ncbi:MAG TPA: Uma2 family endonuclease [Frankiaceae bacterium]|nr:Uma2 family endonuclease [Frankiaceae bacterium]